VRSAAAPARAPLLIPVRLGHAVRLYRRPLGSRQRRAGDLPCGTAHGDEGSGQGYLGRVRWQGQGAQVCPLPAPPAPLTPRMCTPRGWLHSELSLCRPVHRAPFARLLQCTLPHQRYACCLRALSLICSAFQHQYQQAISGLRGSQEGRRDA
jgi:hypothetical protein